MVRSRTQSTRPSAQAGPTRGITSADVDGAADTLLRTGERPTVEKVRLKIGRGSPNTINPLLDQWWRRLAGRLDTGPAALHRLPQAVAMAAESLWLNAVQDARERVNAEQRATKAATARERQDVEIRSHVLSIREAELNDRIAERDRRIGHLEREVEALTTMLRKEQTSRLAAERRVEEQRAELAGRRGRAPRKPTAARPRTPKPRKATRNPTRDKHRARRKVPANRRARR